jgi:stage III sporulation protein AC
MDVSLIFKVATIGIIVAIVNMILAKLGRDEYVTLTTLSGIIITILVLLNELSQLFSTIQTVFNFQ